MPQDKLFEIVKVALKDLGWSYRIEWGKEFEGHIPTTNWSWHHEFRVTFPASGVIEMESRSAYREMLFDFGRNKRDVESFFASLEHILARGSRAPA